MSLVSGNIGPLRRTQIFAVVPLGGGVKLEWGCRRRQFLAIWVAPASETSEIIGQQYYMTICYPLSACIIDCTMNDLD